MDARLGTSVVCRGLPRPLAAAFRAARSLPAHPQHLGFISLQLLRPHAADALEVFERAGGALGTISPLCQAVSLLPAD